MRSPADTLWRHHNFMRLWSGQTISQLGSQISGAAIPFTALTLLNATPVQMGLLAAAETAPVLFFGLLAGAWVDRLRRRPLLIAADLGRALLLGSIPASALLGQLGMAQLYIVGALASLLTLLFDSAHYAYLPALIPRERLVEGNSKLGTSASLAEIGGPPLGGALVQLISAPLTVLLDALSFAASALLLWRIRSPEPPPAQPARQQIRHDIAAGLKLLLSNPLQRALLGSTVTISFAGGIFGAVYYLYAYRELTIPPALLGVVIGVGGVGALVGALLAERVVRRHGLGPTIVGALALGAATQLLIPLAHAPLVIALPLMFAAQLGDVALAIYFIAERSLRQALTPERALGRLNASLQFLSAGFGPLGALIGGALAERVGPRPAVALGALGMLAACLWVLCSPVRTLRELPVTDAPATVEAAA